MTRRVVVSAIVMVMLVGALVWAATCRICGREIPEGEKYCAEHKPGRAAVALATEKEEEFLAEGAKTRSQYIASLKRLRQYYAERGHARGMRNTEAELQGVLEAQHVGAQRWDDEITTQLAATTPTPEADKLLEEGNRLRNSGTPFNRAQYLRKAAAKYREILTHYPQSTAVDSAAFALGEIYSSSAFHEYKRAVKFFDLCYLANPQTKHDALYRAAKVCDDDLGDYENAARYYELAATSGRSIYTRKMSAARLAQLRKHGFGISRVPEETEEQAPAASP